jgi:hypothetical protein
MRVNITYSVDLNDIPLEIDKLLRENKELLDKIMQDLESVSKKNPLEIIEVINSSRESLAVFDMRLTECNNILSGFIDIRAKGSTHQFIEVDETGGPDDEGV